jgi:hypothetical protein
VKLLCRLIGHRGEVMLCNTARACALGHLSCIAGTFSICARCEAVWDDLGNESSSWGRVALPPSALVVGSWNVRWGGLPDWIGGAFVAATFAVIALVLGLEQRGPP